jgi:hypothetical protein
MVRDEARGNGTALQFSGQRDKHRRPSSRHTGHSVDAGVASGGFRAVTVEPRGNWG